MSYFDGIFVVNDVYQLRLAEVWPVYGYGDPIITPIDSLYYLTKFVATGTSISYPFNSDISTNKLNLNIVGDTKASNFNPYEPGYYSAYFDGTGDYLQIPDNAAFVVGTGDFTIEAWIYPTQVAASEAPIFKVHSAGSIMELRQNTNKLDCYLAEVASSPTVSTGTIAMAVNTWNHVAFVRTGTTTYTFVNGVLDQTKTSQTQNLTTTVTTKRIAANQTAGYFFTGYISNFRFVKGTALYTSNFTPSTAPLTAISGTSLLTCQSNRFIDNSTNNFTITKNGDTKIVSANPFTPNVSYSTYGSTYMDGTGDFVTIPYQNAPSILTSDFTIEMWVYPLVVNAFQPIFGQWLQTTGNGGFLLSLNSSGQFAMSFGAQSEASDFLTSSATSIANSWHHVAVVRSGSAFTLYVNGVSTATGTSSATRAALSVNYSFGNYYNGSGVLSASATSFGGYLSDVRMSSAAVYTGNFTPPVAPVLPIASSLPYRSTANVNTTFATTNVLMLTMQNNQPHNNTTFLDKSNYRHLITRNGNANQGTVTPYKGSWSNYFGVANGNSLYISAQSSGTGGVTLDANYTIEMWLYPTGASGSGYSMLVATNTNGGYFQFYYNSTGQIGYYTPGYGQLTTSAPALTFNKWQHVALVRSSNVVKVYVDGVEKAFSSAITDSSTIYANYFGGLGTVYNTFGFISNLRVLKGTALYTSTFSPPTSPLLPITNTQLLTSCTNRLIDLSPNNYTLSRAGSVTVSTETPFSPAYTQPTPTSYSVSFDGNGDYLTVSAGANSFPGDFTFEFWFYPTTDGYSAISGDTNNSYLFQRQSGNISVYMSGTDFPIGTGSAPTNTWTHIAWVRNGTTSTLYINGVNNASRTLSGTLGSASTMYFGARGDLTGYTTGYISNLRIVKGTAVYTTTFTPPTAPLTAIANTSVLACNAVTIVDNSTNNFAVTVTGDAKPIMANPFGFNSPTLIDYTANTFGGSVYFDSISDWLTLPSSTLYDLVGDFTVEAWVYPTKQNGGTWTIIDARANGATAAAWIFNLGVTSGTYRVNFYTGTNYTGSTTIPLNTWTHIAFERNGSVLTGYVNGARDYYNASYGTGAISPGATAPRIGSKDQGINSDYELMGYMSDIRFTNGAALYKGPFVPSQRPLQVYGNTTVMLNFTDAAIKDYTMRNNMETTADLKVSSVSSKFGGSSMFFDGTGDYGNITLVSNALILGTSDFTAEMWLNPYTSSGTYYPMTIGSEAAGRLNIITVNGTLVLNLFGATNANLTLSGPVILPNTWTHIAVVRANANIRGYYNGNVLPNTYVTSAVIGNGPLRLGSDSTGGNGYFGYMDDVRITANARYTANFTPAIAVLPTR